MQIIENVVLDHKGFMDKLAGRAKAFRPVTVKKIKMSQASEKERKIEINDGELVAEGPALDKVAGFVHVPVGFLKSCPLELANHNLERMLKEVKDGRQIIAKDTEVLGSKTKSAPHFAAEAAFSAALKKVPKLDKIYFTDLGGAFDARMVFTGVEAKPKVNDITRAGVRAFYSEFMLGKPSIESFSERLVCTNGMCHTETMNRFEFENEKQFIPLYSAAMEKCVLHFQNTVAPQLEQIAKMQVDGAQAIRRIFQSQKLNSKHLDAVLAAHLIENDGTVFGVLQAFTRVANDLPYRDRIRFQSLAADEMVQASVAHCPTCYATS